MQIAGRFDIKRELGQGAMATVYLAVDQKYDRQVALKVLRPEVRWPGAAERFHREIQVAARLAHPNIVPLFDSGDADGALFFIMQYVDGAETLRERLTRDGSLPVAEASGFARDVAAALDYAHRQGVVHRDIKPENILLAEGRAMVLDFGIARALYSDRGDRHTEAGLVIGTPAYMSPEQATGGSEVGPASDLYSLGCVLYEMLGGSPPFTGNTPQRVLVRHAQEAPRPLSSLRPDTPPAMQDLVASLLQKEKAGRPTSAAEVMVALDRPMQASRTAAWWIGGAVLLALIAAFVLLRPRAPPAAGIVSPAEVAVLYLQAPDSALAPVASGLTEALIDRLSQVDGLRVRSSAATQPFRGAAVPIDTIAARLRVGTIVTGVVRGTPERPEVDIRLVAPDGTQLDSRTVRRGNDGPLALQDDLADQVAAFLRKRLGHEIVVQERRAGTRSERAWLLVQHASEARRRAGSLAALGDSSAVPVALREADSVLQLAEREDRNWVVPPVQRGWVEVNRMDLLPGTDAAAVERHAPVAIAYADRVLAKDPSNASALELRGYARHRLARYGTRYNAALLDTAVADLRAASAPGYIDRARALNELSQALMDQDKWTEANLAAKQAWEDDAFLAESEQVLNTLYLSSLNTSQLDDASRWCEEGHARAAGNWLFTFCRLAMMVMPGGTPPDADRAWTLVRDLARLAPPAERQPARWNLMVATILARAGHPDSAEHVIAQARRQGRGDPALDFYEAAARVALGQPDSAIALLRSLVERQPEIVAYIRRDPAFLPLNDDPRFIALMKAPAP